MKAKILLIMGMFLLNIGIALAAYSTDAGDYHAFESFENSACQNSSRCSSNAALNTTKYVVGAKSSQVPNTGAGGCNAIENCVGNDFDVQSGAIAGICIYTEDADLPTNTGFLLHFGNGVVTDQRWLQHSTVTTGENWSLWNGAGYEERYKIVDGDWQCILSVVNSTGLSYCFSDDTLNFDCELINAGITSSDTIEYGVNNDYTYTIKGDFRFVYNGTVEEWLASGDAADETPPSINAINYTSEGGWSMESTNTYHPVNDTTPTFTLATTENANCSYGIGTDQNFSSMNATCTGMGTQSHTCTVAAANAVPITTNTSIYFGCIDSSNNENTTSTAWINYNVSDIYPPNVYNITVNDTTPCTTCSILIESNSTDNIEIHSGWWLLETGLNGTPFTTSGNRGIQRNSNRNNEGISQNMSIYFNDTSNNIGKGGVVNWTYNNDYQPDIDIINVTGCTEWQDTSYATNCTTNTSTPTLYIFTHENAFCRISNSSQNFTQMTATLDCETTGGTSHTCTLDATVELSNATESYIYADCKDSFSNMNITNQADGGFNITFLNESVGAAACSPSGDEWVVDSEDCSLSSGNYPNTIAKVLSPYTLKISNTVTFLGVDVQKGAKFDREN